MWTSSMQQMRHAAQYRRDDTIVPRACLGDIVSGCSWSCFGHASFLLKASDSLPEGTIEEHEPFDEEAGTF
eukprot:5115434-Amphidinium_carterae.1